MWHLIFLRFMWSPNMKVWNGLRRVSRGSSRFARTTHNTALETTIGLPKGVVAACYDTANWFLRYCCNAGYSNKASVAVVQRAGRCHYMPPELQSRSFLDRICKHVADPLLSTRP